jgi:hypothetical protein
MYCPRCGIEQAVHHRFCFSCGTAIPAATPGSRPKVSQWFWSTPAGPQDSEQAALRVSCYLEEFDVESDGVTVRVPRDHVRFSVWIEDEAVCAVSIPNHEAERLVEFLQSWLPPQGHEIFPRNALNVADQSK